MCIRLVDTPPASSRAGREAVLRGGFCFSGQVNVRTIVYVDGFNLYYGCVKGTPCKWLDIHGMCQELLPPNEISAVKYFTAKVNARPSDPDGPKHQEIYLRALRANPKIKVTLGKFLTHKVWRQKADGSGKCQVINTEEKGSDVNIATQLLRDAFRRDFEVGVLVTNDSDLVAPIQVVTQELGLKVGILFPVLNGGRHPSRELVRIATFRKEIRKGVLQSNQLPDPVITLRGEIRKPASW